MRELLQQNHNDINNDSNFRENIQTFGEPSSYCENASSSEENRAHEKAIHTPTTSLNKPSGAGCTNAG